MLLLLLHLLRLLVAVVRGRHWPIYGGIVLMLLLLLLLDAAEVKTTDLVHGWRPGVTGGGARGTKPLLLLLLYLLTM